MLLGEKAGEMSMGRNEEHKHFEGGKEIMVIGKEDSLEKSS